MFPVLDVLAQRQPFVIASARALNTVTQGQVQGYVSGHAVTNIFYILRRQIDKRLIGFSPQTFRLLQYLAELNQHIHCANNKTLPF
jgi:hypothetical protein